MRIKLHVWRQSSRSDKGHMESYELDNVVEEMSFLEMMDTLNEKLTVEGKEPVAFDHDCREGVCGMCSMVIMAKPTAPSPRQPLANSTCGTSTMAQRFSLNHGEPVRFPSFATSSLIDRHSTASFRREGTSATTPAPSLIPTQFQSSPISQKPLSTRRRVLVAARALPLALTGQRCSSPRPKRPTLDCCRRANLSDSTGLNQWFHKWNQKVSVPAEITPNVRPNAQKVSASHLSED